MEKKRISISTFLLIIAVIVIIVMAICIYAQKTSAETQIAQLESNASEMKQTIDNLQGKLDIIANTISSNSTDKTEQVEFDTIIEISKIASLDYSNKEELQKFYDKYNGKTVKVTGVVTGIEDNVIVTSVDVAETVVHIGETKNDSAILSASSADLKIRNQINNLKEGKEISIVGIIEKDTQPIQLRDITIIEE